MSLPTGGRSVFCRTVVFAYCRVAFMLKWNLVASFVRWFTTSYTLFGTSEG